MSEANDKGWSMTIGEFVEFARTSNAGYAHMAARIKGKVSFAVIAVDGEFADEALSIVESVYDKHIEENDK